MYMYMYVYMYMYMYMHLYMVYVYVSGWSVFQPDLSRLGREACIKLYLGILHSICLWACQVCRVLPMCLSARVLILLPCLLWESCSASSSSSLFCRSSASSLGLASAAPGP